LLVLLFYEPNQFIKNLVKVKQINCLPPPSLQPPASQVKPLIKKISFADSTHCPNAVNDDTILPGTCPNGNQYGAVCNVECVDSTNNMLFAPVPHIAACSSVGTWDSRRPYDNLVLPGCTGTLATQSITPQIDIL